MNNINYLLETMSKYFNFISFTNKSAEEYRRQYIIDRQIKQCNTECHRLRNCGYAFSIIEKNFDIIWNDICNETFYFNVKKSFGTRSSSYVDSSLPEIFNEILEDCKYISHFESYILNHVIDVILMKTGLQFKKIIIDSSNGDYDKYVLILV
jgi:hypothetical protein